ncbi:hypothetical protein T07_2772 [Trichinella nelsoni]|uniref:Uncharacterized protein n=1 Tax=Trichinella nelsoni TaxID=6336 RepID=A0A0V0SC79_9BILA|nr:hypothetical protein T07_2772 [Trichinella nelsoni]
MKVVVINVVPNGLIQPKACRASAVQRVTATASCDPVGVHVDRRS